MLSAIFSFEFKKRVRQPSTFLYFAVFFLVTFLLFLASGGTWDSVSVGSGGSNKEFANSPHTVAQIFQALSLFLMIVVAAIFGQSVFQDYNHRIYSLFFTKPINKRAYLLGRFLAALLVCLVIALGIPAGAWLATLCSWWVDVERFGPNSPALYLWPVLSNMLPNIFLGGAIFFMLASLKRRMMPVYMGAVILVIGYLIAGSFINDMDNRTMAGLIDPFGSSAMSEMTRYWSVTEKNHTLVPLSGILLANRILWILVGMAALALTLNRFSFSHVGVGGGKAEMAAAKTVRVSLQPVTPDFGSGFAFKTFSNLARLQFFATVKNVYFMVIVSFGVLFVFANSVNMGAIFGTETYPVTYQILGLVSGLFALFMLIVITFSTGELVWRERDAGMDQISDVLPIPNLVPMAAKCVAMLGVVVLLLVVMLFSGLTIQVFNGYFNFELGQYFTTLFYYRMIDYALLVVLALTVHTLVNRKFMGHGVMFLYYAVLLMLGGFGFEHTLYRLFQIPSVMYSDMNGYGHWGENFNRYSLYWGALAMVFLGLINLFWVRGKETNWRKRFALAKARLQGPARLWTAGWLVVFVGMGSYIFYNTNIQNKYVTSSEQTDLRVAYEQTYKETWGTWPQPVITGVKTEVDIYPKERELAAHMVYQLENRSDQPVDKLILISPSNVTLSDLSGSIPLELIDSVDDYDVTLYDLAQPLLSGASMSLDFKVKLAREGFPLRDNLTQVVYNGTFFNNGLLFPMVGYQKDMEITDDRERKEKGLPERPRMPPLSDQAAHNEVYLGAERINFEAVVSTSADQTAIAPGYLQREWQENGRNYFHYKMDHKIWNFYSFMSAEYEVRRDRWNDVAIEIYYHKGHEYNLDAMFESIKDSLAYFTANFSPYQHSQVRIIEFPRYASFAQSFPNTIPFSESIGFIARVDPNDPDDLDYPYYVTSHEVAHQWWAHQVCGANVQGATVLSESLSQYSALMVMQERFGREKMKRFLRHELDQYLMGRSMERMKELPLALNENQQYIHYNKGSLVFFALQDYMGEEALNRALSRFLDKYAFASEPYPDTMDLYRFLKEETPEQYHTVLDDLYLHITLWDNRALSASSRLLPGESGGGYEVTLKLKSGKVRSDEIGNEVDQPLQEWVDIGVFDKDDQPLYVARHEITEAESEITVRVEGGEPVSAGIDPYHKLIDRDPDDNLTKIR